LGDEKDIWPVKKGVPLIPKGFLSEQVEVENQGEPAVPCLSGKWPLKWR